MQQRKIGNEHSAWLPARASNELVECSSAAMHSIVSVGISLSAGFNNGRVVSSSLHACWYLASEWYLDLACWGSPFHSAPYLLTAVLYSDLLNSLPFFNFSDKNTFHPLSVRDFNFVAFFTRSLVLVLGRIPLFLPMCLHIVATPNLLGIVSLMIKCFR